MTSAASALITTLAKTREQGDITLKCEGKDIKAHSFILKERSEYFKTAEAFNAATHNTTKVIEVKECRHLVLETVINFMYGNDIPDFYSTADVESVLFMADLYLMEDLKDAVASHMAPHLEKDNILDIYHLADKYTASKLREVCRDFIVTNIDFANVAKKVLGIGATTTLNRRFGGSNVVKKDMIIRRKTTSKWWKNKVTGIHTALPPMTSSYELTCWPGTVGRIVDDSDGKITVLWDSGYRMVCNRSDSGHFEILTPPINTNLFQS